MAKRNSSGGGFGRFFAILLALIIGAGVVMGFVYREHVGVIWDKAMNFLGRVDDEVKQNEANKDENVGVGDEGGYIPGEDANVGSIDDYAGVIVEPGESYVMTESLAFLATDLKETETGFEPATVELTATVLPYGVSQDVAWSVEFVNPSSTWATDKTVTDYITITPKTEKSNVATLTCKYPFGEQIKIVCSALENETIKAECTVDITKRIKSVSASFGDIPLNFGGITDVTVELYRYADYEPGGKYTSTIEYYPYTLGADFSTREYTECPDSYFEIECGNLNHIWANSGGGLNDCSDGYYVLNGIDLHIEDENYEFLTNSRFTFGWKFMANSFTADTMGLTYSLMKKSYEELIELFENIDNGNLFTVVIDIYYSDYIIETGEHIEKIYESYKTLINISGYTYTPKTESVELNSGSITI